MGGSDAPRGVDSDTGSAQHHHVRHGFDANTLFAAAVGEDFASELLRGECVSAAAGTDSACLRAGDTEFPQGTAAARD